MELRIRLIAAGMMLGLGLQAACRADLPPEMLQKNVKEYFGALFDGLAKVAEAEPTVDTFREHMKPMAEKTDGFFGGTLVDTNFVIRQCYFKRNFLAVGFDLKKVEQLDDFWKMMREKPEPQLSEPGHGSLVQPRLIAMRYPVIEKGKLVNIVSMMVRTGAFLEAVGLDKCQAYKIICRGVPAEEKGKLSDQPLEVKLGLPSTEWVIQYDPPKEKK
ncbi:MAG TPA: hypothetical protein PKM67_08000 [Kiritimatiellia bacterium]|nr:hypothetical protein [Kiritimatiellia bacterium]